MLMLWSPQSRGPPLFKRVSQVPNPWTALPFPLPKDAAAALVRDLGWSPHCAAELCRDMSV